ncbi:MAG: hypothetical protein LBH74_08495 [Nitrososphaerota archaeon]|jgi:hypothetical protein|nr:hypothetical protein [Nitrososphaerota archaeon]
MDVASSLLLPIVAFAFALVVGVCFNFVPIRSKRHKPLPLIVFAIVTGISGLIFTFLFHSILYTSLNSFDWFQNFAVLFEGMDVSIIKHNAPMVAAVVIIVAGEIGLGLGFGVTYVGTGRYPKNGLVFEEANIGPVAEAVNLANLVITKNYAETIDQNLRRDEQSVMELFLYGKVCEIVPKIAPGTPEGYLYDGIPQLDWDTKHSRQVLDALVRKGYLNAELVDKVIVCQTCGLGNVRVAKTCPECGSFLLQKEELIEHFSCGAMEQENTFETPTGDLVCPKCKIKLDSGADYRILSHSYRCLGCNTINQTPKFIVKCDDCTTVADIDDEPEILLCKYTVNMKMPLHEFQHIKPLDTCVRFFKALGYTIVVPAFISGRSGIQHLFDLLILDRVSWAEPPKNDVKIPTKSITGNTLVEVLLSTQPIKAEELTRIFGKPST